MSLSSLDLHHIGIAVRSFERSLAYYSLLGYERVNDSIVRDELQFVDLIMLTHKLQPDIELVKPYSSTSPVNKYLKDHGISIYHFCYEVEDFESTIKDLKSKFRIFNVSKPKPAILFNYRPVTFYFIHEVGLIELLQK
jgi:methylmalonyl-CoA/ethylmalonyl-CoA epimerase